MDACHQLLILHLNAPQRNPMMVYLERRFLLINLEKAGRRNVCMNVFQANIFLNMIVSAEDCDIVGMLKKDFLNGVHIL